MSILSLLRWGRLKWILSHSHGTGLGMMNRYFWFIHWSSILPWCQSWMLQSPVCHTPARKSKSFGAAGRHPMDLAVHMPVVSPQSSTIFLLPDGYRRQCNQTTQQLFVSFILANKPAAHQPPDTYALCLPQPTSKWQPPTSSRGCDQWYRGGIGWWCRDALSKSKNLPYEENRLPKVQNAVSMVNYRAAAIPQSHPIMCSSSFCWFRAKCQCWWGYFLATPAWSRCEFSHCRLFGQ